MWLSSLYQKIKKNKLFILIVIVALGLLFRYIGDDWSFQYYLHPDERLYINTNFIQPVTSFAEIFTKNSPFNPHMFYYGTVPLYLYQTVYFLALKIGGVVSFLVVSRVISATVNGAALFLMYLFLKKFWNQRAAFIGTGLLAFLPGVIQVAHFNTTESFLIFFSVAIPYFSLRYFESKLVGDLFITSLLVGLAFGTKIVGISYLAIPCLGVLLHFLQEKEKRVTVLSYSGRLCFVFFTVVAVYVLTNLYSLISFSEFMEQQSYMQSVIEGFSKPPFTIIYEGTPKYLYFLLRDLPWQTSFIFAPIGLFAWGYTMYRWIRTKDQKLLLLFIWPTLYFLVVGTWYAKFSRYFTPVLPFMVVFVAIFLDRLIQYRKKIGFGVTGLILLIQFILAIGFMPIYLNTHTRVQASNWLINNTKQNDTVLGEHWDDPLPLGGVPLANKVNIETMEVYNSETPYKWNIIAGQVQNAEYIVLSSRRVYVSILKNPKLYPTTTNFYNKLFNGDLGYELIQKFSEYPRFVFWQMNDDWADESVQSYDHPPVLIFKNVAKLDKQTLLSKIYD